MFSWWSPFSLVGARPDADNRPACVQEGRVDGQHQRKNIESAETIGGSGAGGSVRQLSCQIHGSLAQVDRATVGIEREDTRRVRSSLHRARNRGEPCDVEEEWVVAQAGKDLDLAARAGEPGRG